MSKDKIKDKILKDGKEQYLSAQEYDLMTLEERGWIKEVLKDEKKDEKEYDKVMRKLWPKVFVPKSLTWRKR